MFLYILQYITTKTLNFFFLSILNPLEMEPLKEFQCQEDGALFTSPTEGMHLFFKTNIKKAIYSCRKLNELVQTL